MSTVQDTDLLLINRAGVDYKCSVADWKASQSKPPAIASVTLADSPEAGRFTSGAFRSTVVADDGTPAATKGIKAWVQGTLKGRAVTDVITAVATITEGGATSAGLYASAPVFAASGYVYGNTAGARLGSKLYACSKTGGKILVSSDEGSSWVEQSVAGLPLGAVFVRLVSYKGALYGCPVNGGIYKSADGATFTDTGKSVGVETLTVHNGILYATSTQGVIKTADGIAWSEHVSYAAGGVRPSPSSSGTGMGSLVITDDTTVVAQSVGNLFYIKAGGVWVNPTMPGITYMAAYDGVHFWVGGSKWLLYGSKIDSLAAHPSPPASTYSVGGSVCGDVFMVFNYDSGLALYNRDTGAAAGLNPLTGHAGIIAGFYDQRTNTQYLIDNGKGIVKLKFSTTTLTFASDKGFASLEAPAPIEQDDKAAHAAVAFTDAAARTITLAYSRGSWAANAGRVAFGPEVVAANTKLFCKLNAGLTVTDLQSADPGYTAVTGAGPYTVTFPATLPTGAAPDTDLPAGTTITTELQAVNSSGTVSKTSNTVTPT